jgi:hypothetical protein
MNVALCFSWDLGPITSFRMLEIRVVEAVLRWGTEVVTNGC